MIINKKILENDNYQNFLKFEGGLQLRSLDKGSEYINKTVRDS